MNQSISEVEVHQLQEEEGIYSYHKQSGYIGFTYAMIGVIIVESVGVSFLLYKWSPILHWLHLALCMLMVIFLMADLRAVVQNPITVRNHELSFKIGLRPKVTIDLSAIKELKKGNTNYENDRKNKEVLDLSLLGFDEPTFELVLYKPVKRKGFIGNGRTISRVFFSVDDQATFHDVMMKKLGIES